MSAAPILADLTRLFREVFDDEALELALDTSPDDIPAWDSFHQITIVIAAERHFGVKLTVTEIEGISDVGSIVRLIEAKAAH